MQKDAARRDTVTSSLRFADTFPQHEHAAVVLGAAAEDLYDMKDFALARSSARKLIERFPNADPQCGARPGSSSRTRPSTWPSISQAEQAYARVLEATPEEDESRPGARRKPGGLDLQAGRAGERARRLSRGGRQFPAHQAGRADVEDLRGCGVRRRRCTDSPEGLDRRGGGAGRLPARAIRGTSSKRRRRSRLRSSTARRASCRRPQQSTSASPRSRTMPTMRAEALLLAGKSVRAVARAWIARWLCTRAT